MKAIKSEEEVNRVTGKETVKGKRNRDRQNERKEKTEEDNLPQTLLLSIATYKKMQVLHSNSYHEKGSLPSLGETVHCLQSEESLRSISVMQEEKSACCATRL